MNLHRLVGKSFGEGVGAFDQAALMELADAVTVEDREAKAFRDEGGLVAIRAAEPDHFEGRALTERDDASLGLGGAG